MIAVSVVNWLMAENGWTFEPGDGVIPDPLFNSRYLHQLYTRADPDYTGRATVPVLWDKHAQTIVNNESSEIIRMFNCAFDAVGAMPGTTTRRTLRDEIDALNARIYDTVNNGVYKAGFATTQEAYEEAIRPLFETLDWLEARLREPRFLCGDRLTEADCRLFTTLVRFDAVYHGHFKCNMRRIVDYPESWAFTRDLYQWPGVAPTVNFTHIKRHYYTSHLTINPHAHRPGWPGAGLRRARPNAGKNSPSCWCFERRLARRTVSAPLALQHVVIESRADGQERNQPEPLRGWGEAGADQGERHLAAGRADDRRHQYADQLSPTMRPEAISTPRRRGRAAKLSKSAPLAAACRRKARSISQPRKAPMAMVPSPSAADKSRCRPRARAAARRPPAGAGVRRPR